MLVLRPRQVRFAVLHRCSGPWVAIKRRRRMRPLLVQCVSDRREVVDWPTLRQRGKVGRREGKVTKVGVVANNQRRRKGFVDIKRRKLVGIEAEVLHRRVVARLC
ncbi:hypothetical protein KCU87_g12, partial [Aureobasidium melanogenum]